MFVMKWLLMAAGFAMFGTAAGVVAYDVYLALQFQRLMNPGDPGAAEEAEPSRPIRWQLAAKIFGLGWAPLLLAMSFVMVPEGSGGLRISQISGVQPRTLYPGLHIIVPFVQHVAEYDLRDRVFATSAAAETVTPSQGSTNTTPVSTKNEVLTVQTREGLTIGLAVTVRYRLDPQKLAYIHTNLAQPVDSGKSLRPWSPRGLSRSGAQLHRA